MARFHGLSPLRPLFYNCFSMIAPVHRSAKVLILEFSYYSVASLLSAPRGPTKPTSAPTRQLLPPSPPHRFPPTRPPQYQTGMNAWVCVACSLGWWLGLTSPSSPFSCRSDSSSPNHQADPGSLGASEVRLLPWWLKLQLERRRLLTPVCVVLCSN